MNLFFRPISDYSLGVAGDYMRPFGYTSLIVGFDFVKHAAVIAGVLLGSFTYANAGAGEATASTYGGRACDIEHGFCAAFTEEHTEKLSSGKCIAAHSLYKDIKGGLMAERNLDFSRDPFMPDYVFKD